MNPSSAFSRQPNERRQISTSAKPTQTSVPMGIPISNQSKKNSQHPVSPWDCLFNQTDTVKSVGVPLSKKVQPQEKKGVTSLSKNVHNTSDNSAPRPLKKRRMIDLQSPLTPILVYPNLQRSTNSDRVDLPKCSPLMKHLGFLFNETDSVESVGVPLSKKVQPQEKKGVTSLSENVHSTSDNSAPRPLKKRRKVDLQSPLTPILVETDAVESVGVPLSKKVQPQEKKGVTSLSKDVYQMSDNSAPRPLKETRKVDLRSPLTPIVKHPNLQRSTNSDRVDLPKCSPLMKHLGFLFNETVDQLVFFSDIDASNQKIKEKGNPKVETKVADTPFIMTVTDAPKVEEILPYLNLDDMVQWISEDIQPKDVSTSSNLDNLLLTVDEILYFYHLDDMLLYSMFEALLPTGNVMQF